MIGSLIVVSLIVTVRGQLGNFHGAMNVQVPLFRINPRAAAAMAQGQRLHSSQDPPRRDPLPRTDFADRPKPDRHHIDLNRPTLMEDRPHRINVPYKAPDHMIRAEKPKAETNKNNPKPNTTTENYDEVKIHEIDPKHNGPLTSIAQVNVTTVRPTTTEITVGSNNTAANVTTAKPLIKDKATGVEVTLDERASFDGDKCPTGFVKIDGMCVEED